jgi:hypothetical protein
LSAAGTHILIQVESHANEDELARRLAQIPGVVHVTEVDGPYDVVAEVAPELDESVTASAIRELDGVLHAIPLTVARQHVHEAIASTGR